MMKRYFLIVLLLGVLIYTPSIHTLSQGSESDPATVLSSIQVKLEHGDDAYSDNNFADALALYDDALTITYQYQDAPTFRIKPYAAQLVGLQYRALFSVGTAKLNILMPDPVSSFFRHDWMQYLSTKTKTLADLESIISNYEEALRLLPLLTSTPENLSSVHLYLGIAQLYTSYLGRSSGKPYDNFQAASELIDVKVSPRLKAAAFFGMGQSSKGELSLTHLIDAVNLLGSQEWFPLFVTFEHAFDLNEDFIDARRSWEKAQSNFDEISLLREQQRLIQYIPAIWQDTAINTYVGIIETRIAWQTNDQSLAQKASDYLKRGLASTSGPALNEVHRLYAYHYLGLALSITGNNAEEALASLTTAETEGSLANIGLQTRPFSTLQRSPVWKDSTSHRVNTWLIGDNLTHLLRYDEALDVLLTLQTDTEKQVYSLKTLDDINYLLDGHYPEILNSTADAYRGARRLTSALDTLDKLLNFYRTALDLLNKIQDNPAIHNQIQRSMAQTLHKKSIIYADLGQLETAIVNLQQAGEIAQSLGDRYLEAQIVAAEADVYLALGNDADAQSAYEKSVSLSEGKDKEAFQAKIYLLLARVKIQNSRPLDTIRETLSNAQRLAESNNLPDIEIESLILLGHLDLNQSLQRIASARDFFTKAVEIADHTNNIQLNILALEALGEFQTEYEADQANFTLYKALNYASQIDDREAIARIYGRIGQLYRKYHQPQLASMAFQHALNVIAEAQKGFLSERATGQFASKYNWVYTSYIDLLAEQRQFKLAFDVSEQARARAFINQLTSGPFDISAFVDTDLGNKERELRIHIEALRHQLADANAQQKDEIASILNDAEAEYDALFDRLQALNPKTKQFTETETISIDDIQSQLATDQIMLSFFTTDEQTLAFIVTKHDFTCVSLDIGQVELSTMVFHARTDLSNRIDATESLQKLFDRIIAPIMPMLKSPNLIIVPHNVLHYLPFAALPINTSTLFSDNFNITYLPSVKALSVLPNQPAQPGKLVAFGISEVPGKLPLPNAEIEVKSIQRIIGGIIFTGSDATVSQVFESASKAGILYFATHGELNTNHPLFSALYLTPNKTNDGRLEVHEIYQLDLRMSTELVVLSACDTAQGKLSDGDEFTGLARAFIYAGTPTVLATLWSVDDRSTAIFMEEFFKARKNGDSLSSALRKAQVGLQSYQDATGAHPYASPYYWAAFELIGRG